MEKAYLIIQINCKKIDYKYIFLDKNNAIKELNMLNNKIYNLNLLYLKNKIKRIHKYSKKQKYKIILEEFQNIYNTIIQNPDIPIYINGNFKHSKKLKYLDYYITEIELNKQIEEPETININQS